MDSFFTALRDVKVDRGPQSLATIALVVDPGDASSAVYEKHIEREAGLISKLVCYFRALDEKEQKYWDDREKAPENFQTEKDFMKGGERPRKLRIFVATPHRIQRAAIERKLNESSKTWKDRVLIRVDTSETLQGQYPPVSNRLIVVYALTSSNVCR